MTGYIDPFARLEKVNLIGPALGALAVTPSNTVDLAQPIRAVTIGTAGGTLAFVSAYDGQSCTTGPLPVGTYQLLARRILATGTTATGLTGWV